MKADITVAKSAGFCFGVQRAVDLWCSRRWNRAKRSARSGPSSTIRSSSRSSRKRALPSSDRRGKHRAPPRHPAFPWRGTVGLRHARRAGHPIHRRHLPVCGQNPQHRRIGRRKGPSDCRGDADHPRCRGSSATAKAKRWSFPTPKRWPKFPRDAAGLRPRGRHGADHLSKRGMGKMRRRRKKDVYKRANL